MAASNAATALSVDEGVGTCYSDMGICASAPLTVYLLQTAVSGTSSW